MTRTESTLLHLSIAFGVGIILSIVYLLPNDASAHTGPGVKKHSHATSTANVSCVQEAVADREMAVMTSYEKHFAAMKTALEERKTALNTAWGKTDAKERRAAIKMAWKEFRADKVATQKSLGKDRKAAWKTFRDTVKNECKEQVPAEEGEANDTLI
jgi:hypothetical protein